MAGLKLITPPAEEPVTIQEIKSQLRIELSDHTFDDQIYELIPVAREWCEGYQNRTFMNRIYELALDEWPRCAIRLPRPPLVAVTSLTYEDRDSVVATWDPSNYLVDTYADPGELWPVSSWPSACLPVVNGIKIKYTAGYGAAPDDVPIKARQAIIMLVSHYFDNGIVEPPQGVKSLLDLDRVVQV